MADVAITAGVSAQTVSRALRDSPNVNPETRRKVLAAVEQLGYRMNSAARALSSGRSRTFGLVVQPSGSVFARRAVTAGIAAAAATAGFAVTLATLDALDPAQLERALVRLGDQGVDGIVIAVPMMWTTPRIDELIRAFPTVTLDGIQLGGEGAIGVDQRAAGRLATEHLLDLGHPQVWHVSGPPRWAEATQRQLGWRDALLARGVDPPPVLEGDWTAASGLRQGQILARIPDVSAVFVSCDDMAFGVVKALREAGRTVPDDVSVTSVDDIALAEFCSPPLTTVRQAFDSIGAAVVDLLLDRTPAELAVAPPELIVRSSTARPAAS